MARSNRLFGDAAGSMPGFSANFAKNVRSSRSAVPLPRSRSMIAQLSPELAETTRLCGASWPERHLAASLSGVIHRGVHAASFGVRWNSLSAHPGCLGLTFVVLRGDVGPACSRPDPSEDDLQLVGAGGSPLEPTRVRGRPERLTSHVLFLSTAQPQPRLLSGERAGLAVAARRRPRGPRRQLGVQRLNCNKTDEGADSRPLQGRAEGERPHSLGGGKSAAHLSPHPERFVLPPGTTENLRATATDWRRAGGQADAAARRGRGRQRRGERQARKVPGSTEGHRGSAERNCAPPPKS